jgi:hypothetical protein
MDVDWYPTSLPIDLFQPQVIAPVQQFDPRHTKLGTVEEVAMAAGKLQAGSRDNAGGAVVTQGIAHVSFPGGSMFLPARNPYDRQILLEHIVDRAHAKERVQALLNDLRRMVHLRRGAATAHCSACGCVLNAACYSTDEHGAAHCLECALGDNLAPVQPKQEPQRSVSS